MFRRFSLVTEVDLEFYHECSCIILHIMRRSFLSFAKFLAFFTLWAIAISIPLSLWYRPAFMAGNPALLRLYWELAPLAMTVAVTLIFVFLIDKNKTKIIISKHWLRDTVIGAGLGTIWIGSAILLLSLLNTLHVSGSADVSLFVIYAVALFANTVMQELLVRGYLFSYLKQKHSIIVAVVATTILFTLMHGGAFESGIVAVLNVLTTSILLSLLLIATGGLWAPILMHFVWNFIGGLILNAVSLGDDVSLIQITFTGNYLLSGGAGRIEGSVVVLAINLVLCGVFAWFLRRQRRSHI